MLTLLLVSVAFSALATLAAWLGDAHPMGDRSLRLFGLPDETRVLPEMARALDATGGGVEREGKRATRSLPALGGES